jgi:hypothetical protein
MGMTHRVGRLTIDDTNDRTGEVNSLVRSCAFSKRSAAATWPIGLLAAIIMEKARDPEGWPGTV